MTARITVGVVDVFVVRPRVAGRAREWDVLTLERAPALRCAGAWETVHGRVERGERPEDAAVRELREETGLTPERLYNVTTHAFYLHGTATVQVAVVFCAFVSRAAPLVLGEEHVRGVWRTRAAAARRFAWPSERDSLARAWALLRHGDAGALEDVLRVR